MNKRTRRRDRLPISEGMMLDAVAAARGRGHRMVKAVRDYTSTGPNPVGWISYCRACGGFLVIDLDESPAPYGRTTEDAQCPGRPPVGPAERRMTALDSPSIVEPAPSKGWTNQELAHVARMVPMEAF